MRFIHISDLHLGKSFPPAQYGTAFAKQRKQELLQTFAKLIAFANENKVDFILCAGDFLNSEDLRAEDLRNINTILSRLERAVFIAIAGNHDCLSEKSPYRKMKWTEHFYLAPAGFGKVALSKFNTMIQYYSWDTKEISTPILEQNDFVKSGQINLLMLHGENKMKSNYLPFDAKKLETLEFDYVALGHIHQPGCIGKNMYYSGSLEPLDFGETGQHGFMLCDILGGWSHFHFVPFAAREYVELEIEAQPQDSELSLAEKIETEIIRENPINLYRIILTGCYSEGARFRCDRIVEALREKEYYCMIEDRTRPEYDMGRLYRENRGNLLGDYIESFLGENVQSRTAENLSALEAKALEYGIAALLSQRRDA